MERGAVYPANDKGEAMTGMSRRFDLERQGDRVLRRLERIGISGQIYSTVFQIEGDDGVKTYASLGEARTQFFRDEVTTEV